MATSLRPVLLLARLALLPRPGAAQEPPATRVVPARLTAGTPDGTLRGAWFQVVDASRERDELEQLGAGPAGWTIPAGARAVGADGRFRLELPDGKYALVAGAEGCDTEVFDLEVTDVPLAKDLEVPLPYVGVARVRLQVVDGDGRPVPTCAVALKLEDGVLDEGALDVTTDAEGRVELALPPGPARFSGHAGRWSDEDEDGEAPPARRCAPLDVTLAAGETAAVRLRLLERAQRAGLHVLVVDPDGKPVPGAWVALQPATVQADAAWRLLGPDGEPPRSEGAVRDADLNARATRTGADGTAHLLDEDRRGAPAGAAVLAARRGPDAGRCDVTHAVDELTTARVVLGEHTARGHVHLALRQPDGGGFVGTVDREWEAAGGEAAHDPGLEPLTSFVLRDLPPGPARIWLRCRPGRPALSVGGGGGGAPPDPVRPTDGGLVARIDVEVRAGEMAEQVVTLQPALLVEVRLLGVDGAPVHGPVVVRRHAEGPLSRERETRRTTADGWLWLPFTHPDDAIDVALQGPRSAPVRVPATAGPQELRLPKGP